MRIGKRLPAAVALGLVVTLGLAAPAFAASPNVGGTNFHWKRNEMPEVPYAAILPVLGVGVAALALRRRLRPE